LSTTSLDDIGWKQIAPVPGGSAVGIGVFNSDVSVAPCLFFLWFGVL
jgi:hypothetical protein